MPVEGILFIRNGELKFEMDTVGDCGQAEPVEGDEGGHFVSFRRRLTGHRDIRRGKGLAVFGNGREGFFAFLWRQKKNLVNSIGPIGGGGEKFEAGTFPDWITADDPFVFDLGKHPQSLLVKCETDGGDWAALAGDLPLGEGWGTFAGKGEIHNGQAEQRNARDGAERRSGNLQFDPCSLEARGWLNRQRDCALFVGVQRKGDIEGHGRGLIRYPTFRVIGPDRQNIRNALGGGIREGQNDHAVRVRFAHLHGVKNLGSDLHIASEAETAEIVMVHMGCSTAENGESDWRFWGGLGERGADFEKNSSGSRIQTHPCNGLETGTEEQGAREVIHIRSQKREGNEGVDLVARGEGGGV